MQIIQNRGVTWLFVVLVGLPFIVLVAFNALWEYSCTDPTQRRPLTAVADWPGPIQDLRTALEASGADTSSFSVYLLYGHPGQILSTVVCRVHIDDAGWDTVAAKLDLQSIPTSEGVALASEVVPSSDASWWPAINSNSAYFASARLIAGDEGDLYYAARDNEDHVAYVHYHFNF